MFCKILGKCVAVARGTRVQRCSLLDLTRMGTIHPSTLQYVFNLHWHSIIMPVAATGTSSTNLSDTSEAWWGVPGRPEIWTA